jgi:hypothetical protein
MFNPPTDTELAKIPRLYATKDVASAVKFYRKYNSLSSWNSTDRLEKEHPEIYKIYNESDMSAHPSNYDKWLFDYCFGDVIDE